MDAFQLDIGVFFRIVAGIVILLFLSLLILGIWLTVKGRKR